jgi:ATP:ADP antiporter, AAA family
VKYVSNLRASFAPGVDAWAISLQYLMGGVVGSGCVLLATYKWMQDNIVAKKPKTIAVLTTTTTSDNSTDSAAIVEKVPKKKKPKMTMKESAKFLLSSPYIRDMALLVISYGMCINIVEVSWKAKLKLAFPDPNSYSAFMGNFSSATGIVTLFMMLLGRTIFAKFGWGVAAVVTPAVSEQLKISGQWKVLGRVSHKICSLFCCYSTHISDDWYYWIEFFCK